MVLQLSKSLAANATSNAQGSVHSKPKGQNSRTFQGLLKDVKLQFSNTKSIDKKTYHTRTTPKFRLKYILQCTHQCTNDKSRLFTSDHL